MDCRKTKIITIFLGVFVIIFSHASKGDFEAVFGEPPIVEGLDEIDPKEPIIDMNGFPDEETRPPDPMWYYGMFDEYQLPPDEYIPPCLLDDLPY